MELPPKKNIDDSFFNMENCYKISVHLSKDDLIFDRGTYDKDILKNDISKQDYDNIINEAEKIISSCWIKKRKYEEIKTPNWIYMLFLSSLICFIIYMFLLFYSSRRKNGKALMILSIIFAIFGCIIAAMIVIYNLLRQITKQKNLEDFIAKDLNQFCKMINKKISNNLLFQFNKVEKSLECFVKNVIKKQDFEWEPLSESSQAERKNIGTNNIYNTESKSLNEDYTNRKINSSEGYENNRPWHIRTRTLSTFNCPGDTKKQKNE